MKGFCLTEEDAEKNEIDVLDAIRLGLTLGSMGGLIDGDDKRGFSLFNENERDNFFAYWLIITDNATLKRKKEEIKMVKRNKKAKEKAKKHKIRVSKKR
jgi:hypothetical protein